MSTKVKGYAGKILRVNLTEGKIWDWIPNEETLRMYLGGTGIGAKILYDEVPPKAEWSDLMRARRKKTRKYFLKLIGITTG